MSSSKKVFLFLACWAVSVPLPGQNPIADMPYTQEFETPFSGTNLFYPEWMGNKMHLISRHLEDGNYALQMLPEGEETTTFAQVKLNLSGKENVFVEFWYATRKNETEEDMKRTKLSIGVSTNGTTFGYGMKIGPEMGLPNEDSDFQKVVYPLPAHTFNQPNVYVRFNVKAGGGKCLPAIILIDDVLIDYEASDIFPPFMWGETSLPSYSQIEFNFSEPLLPASALNKQNYTFTWPEENNLNPPGSATLANVKAAALSDGGKKLSLTLNPGLTQGAYYTLLMENICDLNGNCTNFEVEVVRNVLDPGTLIFSELLFADPGPAKPKWKLQFVEIYNTTGNPVPIGGLRIKGAISAHNMPNIKIPSGGYHVITRNDESFLATFGFPAWEWKGSWIEYSPSHEGEPLGVQELYIQTTVHHGETYVDHMVFDLAGNWAPLNVMGFSVERTCFDGNASMPSNWALANGEGTPSSYVYTYGGQTFDITATPGKGRSTEVACGSNGDMIQICHTTPVGNQILCIDPVSLADHLAHGDWIGYCEGDNCGGSPSAPGRVMNALPPVVVAPNPFSKTAFVATSPDFGPITRMELRNISGQLMQSFDKLSARNIELSAKGLPPGMYLLYIWSEQAFDLQKLEIIP